MTKQLSTVGSCEDMEAEKSKICSQQVSKTQESQLHGSHSSSRIARDPRRAQVSVQVQRQEKASVPAQQSHGGAPFYWAILSSVDTRAAHIREDNLLNSVYR